MASVQSTEVYSTKDVGNGIHRKRFRIVLLDNDGVTHEFISSPQRTNQADDGATYGDTLLTAKEDEEEAFYVEEMENERTPFDSDPKWKNREQLLFPVLTRLLNTPAHAPFVLANLDLFDNVTDQEIIDVLSKSQGEVDTIRSDVANAKSNKQNLNGRIGGP